MIHHILETIDPDAEVRSLDFDSPYLDQLRTYSDQQDYPAITGLCEELAEQGIYDVRLLLMGIYAEVREPLLPAIPDLFQNLGMLLGSQWEQIGPIEKKAKYAKGSLSWIIKQLRVDLETEQVDATPRWNEWISGQMTQEELEALLAMIDEIKQVAAHVLEDESQPVLLSFTELVSWFNTELMPKLPSSAANAEPEEAALNHETEQAAGQSAKSVSASSQGRSVEGSYHLDVLVRKMDLFRQLVEEGDMLKAAIIAADISAILEQFDPKRYFPQLFSEYLFVMVNQSNRIAEAMDMRDSPQWMVLNELYQIDMDKFKAIQVQF